MQMKRKKKLKTKPRAGHLDQIIGANMLKYRTDKGLSQIDIAYAADVTFQQIQKYEKGTNRVSASTLFVIAGHMGGTRHQYFCDVLLYVRNISF